MVAKSKRQPRKDPPPLAVALKCQDCGGRGLVSVKREIRRCDGTPDTYTDWVPCKKCKGTGLLSV